MTDIVSLEALVGRITPGQSLAIPVNGVAMAATAALIEAGVTGLRLVCVPISGLQADLLIGAGNVSAIETSAGSLGEAGGAARLAAGIRAGAFDLRDSTCPAILAGLLAAAEGGALLP